MITVVGYNTYAATIRYNRIPFRYSMLGLSNEEI